jgi:glutamate racemase
MKNQAIGIIDSGLGGLSVFREVVELLPIESIFYFADSRYCPYGERSVSEIKMLTEKVLNFLIQEKQCKLILIACNTITTSIISDLRQKYEVPLVGIEPAIKTAVQKTKTKKIGLLATEGTLKSQAFQKLKKFVPDNIILYTQNGEGLAEIVENNLNASQETQKLLRNYLQIFIDNDVDQLILGCTHYPFLSAEINLITQNKINLINPAKAVAQQVKFQLEQHNLLASTNQLKQYHFFTSGNSIIFDKALKLFPFEWSEKSVNIEV